MQIAVIFADPGLGKTQSAVASMPTANFVGLRADLGDIEAHWGINPADVHCIETWTDTDGHEQPIQTISDAAYALEQKDNGSGYVVVDDISRLFENELLAEETAGHRDPRRMFGVFNGNTKRAMRSIFSGRIGIATGRMKQPSEHGPGGIKLGTKTVERTLLYDASFCYLLRQSSQLKKEGSVWPVELFAENAHPTWSTKARDIRFRGRIPGYIGAVLRLAGWALPAPANPMIAAVEAAAIAVLNNKSS